MRRSGGFPPAQMTKAANRDAFARWCASCTDKALATADPASLARSYGLDIRDVNSAIQRQRFVRSAAA